jgi:hypothetical protein
LVFYTKKNLATLQTIGNSFTLICSDPLRSVYTNAIFSVGCDSRIRHRTKDRKNPFFVRCRMRLLHPTLNITVCVNRPLRNVTLFWPLYLGPDLCVANFIPARK